MVYFSIIIYTRWKDRLISHCKNSKKIAETRNFSSKNYRNSASIPGGGFFLCRAFGTKGGTGFLPLNPRLRPAALSGVNCTSCVKPLRGLVRWDYFPTFSLMTQRTHSMRPYK